MQGAYLLMPSSGFARREFKFITPNLIMPTTRQRLLKFQLPTIFIQFPKQNKISVNKTETRHRKFPS